MSLADLDPVLAQPKRLAALAMCAATSKVTFALIRDHLELQDSDASKQMQKLVDCGYVEARKTGRAASRQTWFTITDQGRNALSAHVEALNTIIRAELPPPSDSDFVEPLRLHAPPEHGTHQHQHQSDQQP